MGIPAINLINVVNKGGNIISFLEGLPPRHSDPKTGAILSRKYQLLLIQALDNQYENKHAFQLDQDC